MGIVITWLLIVFKALHEWQEICESNGVSAVVSRWTDAVRTFAGPAFGLKVIYSSVRSKAGVHAEPAYPSQRQKLVCTSTMDR